MAATLLAAAAAAPSTAAAQEGNCVDYTCDSAAARIVVEHVPKDSAAGRRVLAVPKADRFDPSTLIVVDKRNENRIARVTTVQRTCRLSDGVYTFTLAGSPGNFNMQGRCGGAISGFVVIKRNGKVLVSERLEGDCQARAPVIARIVVAAGEASPVIERVPEDKFGE